MESDGSGRYHRVKDGEHLVAILLGCGRYDVDAVWNHDRNAELREQGRSPHLLLQGDRVFLPALTRARHRRGTGSTHRFVRKVPPLKLRLDVGALSPDEDGFRNTPCTLELKTSTLELESDANGFVECVIPPDTREATLEIAERVIRLRIGGLDPVDSSSGQLQRLVNLGFIEGCIDERDEEELASAVEAFQRAHGLKIDASCGPVTQEKLVEVHGS